MRPGTTIAHRWSSCSSTAAGHPATTPCNGRPDCGHFRGCGDDRPATAADLEAAVLERDRGLRWVSSTVYLAEAGPRTNPVRTKTRYSRRGRFATSYSTALLPIPASLLFRAYSTKS